MGVVHTTAEGEVVSGTTEIPESGTELVKGEWQDPLLALISLMAPALCAGAMGVTVGRFADRTGHRVVLIPGLLGYCASIVW